MTLFQSFVLGLVQGATEFIPVSSSAHLVLVPWLLGWKIEPEAAFLFDVLVQMGTLIAVIVFYWRDLWGMARAVVIGAIAGKPFGTLEARQAWLLVVATLPVGVLGSLLKEPFERVLGSPSLVAAFLLVTAAILAASEYFGRFSRQLESVTWFDALVIGFAQVTAVFPGISRSGATIAGGLARKFDRPAAARFSFLMSVPVMIGVGIVATKDLVDLPNTAAYLPAIAVGFLAAAVVGYLCIRWLIGYLSRRSLYVFAGYCLMAGLACLAVAVIRG